MKKKETLYVYAGKRLTDRNSVFYLFLKNGKQPVPFSSIGFKSDKISTIEIGDAAVIKEEDDEWAYILRVDKKCFVKEDDKNKFISLCSPLHESAELYEEQRIEDLRLQWLFSESMRLNEIHLEAKREIKTNPDKHSCVLLTTARKKK